MAFAPSGIGCALISSTVFFFFCATNNKSEAADGFEATGTVADLALMVEAISMSNTTAAIVSLDFKIYTPNIPPMEGR